MSCHGTSIAFFFFLCVCVLAKMSPISFTWNWMNVRAWTCFRGSKVLVNRVETDMQRTQMKSQGSLSTISRKQHCDINKWPYPTRRRMHSRTSLQSSKTSQHKSVCVCVTSCSRKSVKRLKIKAQHAHPNYNMYPLIKWWVFIYLLLNKKKTQPNKKRTLWSQLVTTACED